MISDDEISITYTSLIQQYLNLHCYNNASFLAERYAAHSLTAHSVHLLALSYYRTNEKQRCRMLLLQHKRLVQSCASSRYLLALSCFDLGYYEEAQEALLMPSSKTESSGKHVAVLNVFATSYTANDSSNKRQPPQLLPSDIQSFVPHGAIGLHLLGQIYRKTHRLTLAKECYRKSLQLDPFMICSFLALCELGSGPIEGEDDVLQIFGVPILPLRGRREASGSGASSQNVSATPAYSGVGHAAATETTATVGKGRHPEVSRPVPSNLVTTPSTQLSSSMYFETPSSTSLNAGRSIPSHKPTSSLYQGATLRTTTLRGGTERRIHRSSSLSSATRGPGALFDSPNLTPIHATPKNQEQLIEVTSGVNPPTSAAKTTPLTAAAIRAAHSVAARLYYDESPETKRILPKQRRVRFSSHGEQEVDQVFGVASVGVGQEVPISTTYDRPSGMEKRVLFRGSSVKKGGSNTYGPAPAGTSMGTATRAAPTPTIRRSTFVKPDSAPNLNLLGEKNSLEEAISASESGEEVREESGEENGAESILSLLATLGLAYWYLCNYQCQPSLRILQSRIPLGQYRTGWVLHQVGRSFFEMVQYPKALAALEEMARLEPHRMAGLDILSTVLWHLKDEIRLCTLAQRVVELNKLSPECWCVVGNCLSLQKEHETALTFFQRAIQLDDGFTYAYTLSGHEFVANEDLEKASMCFRKAIQVDERHYNAWYGLGAIYYRQEKFDLAEYHFERARRINPQSSVLYCHLGMVLFANRKVHQALKTLEKVFELDPDNAQARYQKATILIRQGFNVEALQELEYVRDSAPREPSVYFAMGKICKTLGWIEEALRNFITALDLDPKDSNLIKAAMDRLDDPDIDEDVSTF